MKLLVILSPKDTDELAHVVGFCQSMNMAYKLDFQQEKKEERPLVVGDEKAEFKVADNPLWATVRKVVKGVPGGILRKDLVENISKATRKQKRTVGTSIAFFMRHGALKEV